MAVKNIKNIADESEILAKLAAFGMSEKKGVEIVLLDLREIAVSPARFFVICSGNVPSHVNAIADSVFEVIKKATGQNPRKMEGYNNAEWVLLDYFDVMVHVFQKEKREFYKLEELWADGIHTVYEPEEETKELVGNEKGIKKTKAATTKAKVKKQPKMTDEDLLADDESLSARPARRTTRTAAARSRSQATAKSTTKPAAAKGKTTAAKRSTQSTTTKSAGNTAAKTGAAKRATTATKRTATAKTKEK